MKTRHWTLFTNHAAVFFYVLEHPDATIRRVADDLDLAERTVVGALGDLREEGYLLVRKEGRHNVYRANTEGPMKRPEHASYTMREFFAHIQSALNRAYSEVEKQVAHKRPREPSTR
ncbi:MAG: helix-turn-helix transcriptional regulator [Dehalococcoidia bacterium]